MEVKDRFKAHRASCLLIAAIAVTTILLIISPTFAASSNPCSSCHGSQGYTQTLSITVQTAPSSLTVGQTATVTVTIKNNIVRATLYNSLASITATLVSLNGHFSITTPTVSIGSLTSGGSATASWQITALSSGTDSFVFGTSAKNSHQNLSFSDGTSAATNISPNNTPTPSPTPTLAPTLTPSPTPTIPPTTTPTPTPIPTLTPTNPPTATPSPISTPTPTVTQTPNSSPTDTPTPNPTAMTPSTETSIPQATANSTSPTETPIPTTANPTSTTVQPQQPSSPQPSAISTTPTETPNLSQTPDPAATQDPSSTTSPQATSSDQPKVDEQKQYYEFYRVLFYAAISSILAIVVLVIVKISKPVQLSSGRKNLQASTAKKDYPNRFEENQSKFFEAQDAI
jgi:hypothetical protein